MTLLSVSNPLSLCPSHLSNKWSAPKGCPYFFTTIPNLAFTLTALIFISALSVMTSFANSTACFSFILFEPCGFLHYCP